jgi:DNA-binding winged helix-turn-helix (wHTH) protein
MMRFGPFEFDAPRRQLLRERREIHLTPKAFELLATLIAAAPRVMSKREIHERLWPGGVVSDATLVGMVKELRRALDDHDAKAPLIRTVHRVGYAFAAPLNSGAPGTQASFCWLVAAGRRIPLIEGENTIGRDPHSTLQLDHATVSRLHARITLAAAGASLVDLGSKNGTSVGSVRVAGVVNLRDGDRLAFGEVEVTYREASAGLPTATQVSRAGGARSDPGP